MAAKTDKIETVSGQYKAFQSLTSPMIFKNIFKSYAILKFVKILEPLLDICFGD